MSRASINLLLLFDQIGTGDIPPPGSSFRITDAGELRITDDGDPRVTDPTFNLREKKHG